MPKIINVKGVIIPKQNKWIYDWLEYPYTTTDDVLQALQDANGQPVEVYINSYGGSVYDAYEIYTALKEYSGDVLIKIVGLAASAASFIAMASKCLISPLGEVMIHNASTGAQGPHQTMDSTSQQLQNTDKTIAKAYMMKSGKSEEEIRALMAKESWFTAEQAKELGLVDGIMFEEDNTTSNVVPVLYNSLPVPGLRAIQELEKCGSIEELKQKLAMNAEQFKKEALTGQSIVVNSINEKKEKKTMTLEELKNEQPDLYNQIFNEGVENGKNSERQRIKEIEDLAMPGNQELIDEAKFNTGITAEQVAIQIIKAEKTKGNQYLNERQTEIKDSKVIEVNSNSTKTKEVEENEAIEAMANAMNARRGNR